MNEAGSREGAKARRDVEEIASIVVETALQLHRDLGSGLLESVYEAVLAKLLEERGITVERQKPVPIRCHGIEINEGFRLDLLVDNQLIIELKSVGQLHPVHQVEGVGYAS